MKRKHDFFDAMLKLKRKQGARIEGKTVYVLRTQDDIGNKTWGVIDYLVKVHHFNLFFINHF